VKRRPYDVVLMDVHMPEMDGLTAAKHIRASKEAGSNLPIIALTANAFTHDIELCRLAGMNAHVGKPFRTEELLVALGNALRGLSRFAEGAGHSAAKTDADENLPVADFEAIDRFKADSDEEMLRLLIDTFLADTAEKLERFAALARGASTDDSIEEAARLAHSLKSSGAMAGAGRLSRFAHDLELRLRSGGAPLGAAEAEQLAQMFADYSNALKAKGLAA
jgi:response regulator RpfG family c-di-GMP phosphodiesterase